MTTPRPDSREAAADRTADQIATAVVEEIDAQYLLNRKHRHSRWHHEKLSSGHRESWACVPVTDAVFAVAAAAYQAALRAAAHRPDVGLREALRLHASHWEGEAAERVADPKASGASLLAAGVLTRCAKTVRAALDDTDETSRGLAGHADHAVGHPETAEYPAPATEDAGPRPDPDAEYMCPNCVTPWKCNGPHIPEPAS